MALTPAQLAASRRYQERNREKVREAVRRSKAKNKDKYKAYNAAYQKAHPEVRAASAKRYHQRNPDKLKARNAKYFQDNTEKVLNYMKERRAKLRGVKTEVVRRLEVYERDLWICQLCSQPVDKNVRYPDPMSPSLDHKVPLARGGVHSFSNVQLVHWVCNSRKKDRLV